jgi:hypothetical protein
VKMRMCTMFMYSTDKEYQHTCTICVRIHTISAQSEASL